MLYIMRRTQLYLDEAMAKTLAALGRQHGKTVSQLVRESVQARYMNRSGIDKADLARRLAGVWRKRRDLRDIDRVVRRLRSDARSKRLGLG